MVQPPGAIAMNNLGNSSGGSAASPVQHIASPSASGSQNSGSNSAAVNLGNQTPPPNNADHNLAPPPNNADDKPSPNPNTAMRCVKFLACWDCGPIGTIVAFITFVVGTIISYYTMQLAIWTATKDYIEHCQSDQEAQRATIQCQEAAGRPLPPPPFFKHDPTNSTFYRRTLVGGLIGATPSRHYNSLFVWLDVLLLHAIGWMGLSAMCYLAYSLARATWQPHSSSWRPRPQPVSPLRDESDELDDFRTIDFGTINVGTVDFGTVNAGVTSGFLQRRAKRIKYEQYYIKPYHCPDPSCLLRRVAFSREQDLIRHQSQHNSRRFYCSYANCVYAISGVRNGFVRRDNLKRHLANRHQQSQ